jgi:type I restriction enzyme, S subunit
MMAASNRWGKVRFGDMAQTITDRVDDPSTAGVKRYVGLEHLDPGSLRIARWGAPTDVEATKLRFATGDVIFGRRRAYQNKVALADFDGICSAHALVLRAKPDVALPEFLPLFMQSDVFFDRALSISVGSLSPTINWRTLAKQEFELPPLDEQRRIAALLWSAERLVRHLFDARKAAEAVLFAVLRRGFDIGDRPTVALAQVGQWLSGGTPSRSTSALWLGEFPWVSPKDMKQDLIHDTIEHISPAAVDQGLRPAPANSILIVVRGMILAHTFPVAMCTRDMAFNQDMKALVVGPNFDRGYVFWWLKSSARACLALVADSTHGTKRLPSESLLQLRVPCPNLMQQAAVVAEVQQASEFVQRLDRERAAVADVKSRLLEQVLSVGSAA